MITLKYLGKKEDFTLNLPFLSKSYHVAGPEAVVDFTNDDATRMMAENPKMFRVEGIKKDIGEAGVPGPKPKKAVTPPPETKGPDPETKPPEGEKKDELVLTGDGVEGDADEVPTSILMTYKEDELRTYAMQRFGHQFTEDDKRNPMIKKIKELEQKKAQAAS